MKSALVSPKGSPSARRELTLLRFLETIEDEFQLNRTHLDTLLSQYHASTAFELNRQAVADEVTDPEDREIAIEPLLESKAENRKHRQQLRELRADGDLAWLASISKRHGREVACLVARLDAQRLQIKNLHLDLKEFGVAK